MNIDDQPNGIEVPLLGDGVTVGIVRVGDTVRRPRRSFTATVQAFLAHLHERGFTAAPVPMGYDSAGREVLSFVPGDVPREPLPDWATSIEVLVELARLVRRLHDAAESWCPPPDAVWGSLPGSAAPGVVPLFDVSELVSHMDYCPGNVVFQQQLPVGLIDFDLARPTTRLVDVLNALYWWAPLLHPADRAPALVEADVPVRVAAFADAYGLSTEQRVQLVPTAMRRAHNLHITARAAAAADPVFLRFWDQGVKDRMPRAEQWWADNAARVDASLRR